VVIAVAETEPESGLATARRTIRRHREIITEGRQYDTLFVLIEGFAMRCRVLSNGGRQVLNVALPGDFIGYPGCFFARALYSVTAISEVVVSSVSHTRLVTLIDAHPRLATKIFWSFACEAGIYAEHLIDTGRRSALERVAHFLLELHVRLQAIGLADEVSYPMPLTQELVGDALGLSVPHVNRTLRQLRDDDLVVIDNQQVILRDPDGLAALAGFQRAYLDRFRLPKMVEELGERLKLGPAAEISTAGGRVALPNSGPAERPPQ
jgi:CRP-like cAMP-binding protein